MASHDDLVLIINQLLKAMDKMGESLSVVNAIGEDVKRLRDDVGLIKHRVEKMEERICSDQVLMKYEVLSIKETLQRELKPLRRVNIIEDRLCKIEERVSNSRSMDKSHSKSDSLPNKAKKDAKLKASEQSRETDSRVARLETQTSDISFGSAYSLITFDPSVKGRNVRLTINGTFAGRIRVLEHTGLAGVVTNVPIGEDEVYNIRIQETIDKWSDCGIAFGVICEKCPDIEGLPNIYRNLKGTWAINSWNNSEPGKSHTWKDANIIANNGYSLDTRRLAVGTVLGTKRCRNGDLHFFLNGTDKGVAFQNVPRNVYAFVDIVNYVTKLSTFYL